MGKRQSARKCLSSREDKHCRKDGACSGLRGKHYEPAHETILEEKYRQNVFGIVAVRMTPADLLYAVETEILKNIVEGKYE